MVIYTCEKCNKKFNQKGHYFVHINKKFSCNQELDNSKIFPSPSENSKKHKNFEENQEISDEKPKIFIENQIIKNGFFCNYCNKNFSTNFNLNKHCKNSCKVKKLQDQEKENIFKILLAKEEEMKKREVETKKEIQKRDDENKELKDYIKQLSDMNIELNSKMNKLLEKMSVSNINNGSINNGNIINNITITSDKLANFGEEDIKEIDTSLFNKIFGKTGKYIFEASAQNIWFDKPKNKTIYFSDLSRDKAMAHKNGNFELVPITKALITINQQLYKYFKYNLEYLEKTKNVKLLKRFKDEIEKYYKMLFRAYDETDRFQPDDKRLEEFERVVNAGLSQFFYNIKDGVKDNYDKIVDNVKKENIMKKINYEPPKKARGRPRKVIPDNSAKTTTNIVLKQQKAMEENKPKLRNLCNMEEFSEEEIIKVGLEVDEKLKEWKKSLKKRNLI